MKLVTSAILLMLSLALGVAVRADGISDSNTTKDGTSGTVNAGQGETFTCESSTDSFSCMDTDGFVCYGFINCNALGATGAAQTLADFIEDYGYGSFQFVAAGPLVATPEPGTLLLLCAGFVTLGMLMNRFLPVAADT